MSELFEAMADYLKATYPGCQFAGASYDHSIATAVWDICQDEKGSSTPGKISPQRNFREWGGSHSFSAANNPHSLIETYKEALEAHSISYRGVIGTAEDSYLGLSWSLNQETAEWFAKRFGHRGYVYEGQIDKKYVYAYFGGRNESEVVIRPKYVRGLKWHRVKE